MLFGYFEQPKHMFQLLGKKIFSILCSNWTCRVTLGKSRAAVIFPGLPSSFFPILNIRTVLWLARLTMNALEENNNTMQSLYNTPNYNMDLDITLSCCGSQIFALEFYKGSIGK